VYVVCVCGVYVYVCVCVCVYISRLHFALCILTNILTSLSVSLQNVNKELIRRLSASLRSEIRAVYVV